MDDIKKIYLYHQRNAFSKAETLVRYKTRLEHFRIQRESNSLENGNMIWRNILSLLDKIDASHMARSAPQRDFHRTALSACIPIVYGKSYKYNQDVIQNIVGNVSLKKMILNIAARRAGKTTAAAMLAAILILSIPNLTISVVSPNKRSAGGNNGFISKIDEILRTVFKFTNFEKNEERIQITMNSNDTRKLLSFPGGVPEK